MPAGEVARRREAPRRGEEPSGSAPLAGPMRTASAGGGLDRSPGTPQGWLSGCAFRVEKPMQRTVHDYLKALEAGDADKAASLFIPDGWVESPFLGRLPVRQFIKKVAESSRGTKLTVHDVLVSAEGHLRAVAYYLYDWRLTDGSRVAFDCAEGLIFARGGGRFRRLGLFYATLRVPGVVGGKSPEKPPDPRHGGVAGPAKRRGGGRGR